MLHLHIPSSQDMGVPALEWDQRVVVDRQGQGCVSMGYPGEGGGG